MKTDTVAEGYIETLNWCVDKHSSDLERLSQLQNSFDAKINPEVWPTQSEIPTASHFIATEEALGPALDSLFPESNGLQLIPRQLDIDKEQWRNAEWGLWTMITHEMRIKTEALVSLKDCFKCSIGYGIVEPYTITPDIGQTVTIEGKKTRIMSMGKPQVSIRYRYVSPGQIVPYTSGVDFNGPRSTPLSFFIDFYPSWQIEAMFDGNLPGSIGKDELHGDAATIIEWARNFQTSGFSDLREYMEILAGREMFTNRKNLPDSAPVSVPILKVYEEPGKETWIALQNGKNGAVIFEQESEIERVRNPLVKWSAWPDGNRWYPMSMPEALQKVGTAKDLWINFFFDMMTQTKDPRLVVDKSALPPHQRSLYPGQDIYLERGSARDAAAYLQTPSIDPSVAGMGDVLDQISQKIQGRSDLTQKNFTRGGANAFNDLLNTAQGRDRLSSSILETRGLTATYEHVLAFMQKTVDEDGVELIRPVWDADEREQSIMRRTITSDDLRHGYGLLVDTSERRMLGGMSSQERLETWRTLQDRPDVYPQEVNRLYPLPEATIKRIFKSREEQERLQGDRMNREAIAELSNAQQAGPPRQQGALAQQ